MLKPNPTIVHPVMGEIPFVPNDAQVQMFEHWDSTKPPVTDCHRQCGASTAIAYYAAKFISEHHDRNVVIGCRTPADAVAMIERIVRFVEPSSIHVKQRTFVKLMNGNSISAQACTVNMGRGQSNKLVILEDFAFVRNHVAESVWLSVIPSVYTTGGKIIVVSSAPRAGSFMLNLPPTQRISILENKTSTADPAVLRAALGEDWFAAEYLCVRGK